MSVNMVASKLRGDQRRHQRQTIGGDQARQGVCE
jgi:hypothetical protein